MNTILEIMRVQLIDWIKDLEDYELQDVISHLEDRFDIPLGIHEGDEE